MNQEAIYSITKEEIPIIEKTKNEKLEDNFCPASSTKGLIVKKITLRGHVKELYWDIIDDFGYYFCSHKDCEIIYFNNKNNYYFTDKHVKTRVSHKKGDEPRPICYCKNVLEHKLLDEILVTKQATTLEDIKKYTGANTGKLCHITNPSGRCCGPQVNEIIAKGIRLLEEDKKTQLAVLETVHSGCEYCIDTPDLLKNSLNDVADSCKTCEIDWDST